MSNPTSKNIDDIVVEILTSDHMPMSLSMELNMDIAIQVAGQMETRWADYDSESAYRTLSRLSGSIARSIPARLVEQTGVNLDSLIKGDEEATRRLNRHVRNLAKTCMNSMRMNYIKHYGFAVITEESVEWMTRNLTGHTVLEVGAGNGYLARRLRDAGLQMTVTDACGDLKDNSYALGDSYLSEVIQMDAESAIGKYGPSALIWSWPVRSDESGRAFRTFDGELFIYIGEQYNGCTGGDLFSEVLNERYEHIENCFIPSFPSVSDWAALYRRIR